MYTIKKENGHFRAYKNGKLISICFSKTDALHSIWVCEGKVEEDFYILNDFGNVERVQNEQ